MRVASIAGRSTKWLIVAFAIAWAAIAAGSESAAPTQDFDAAARDLWTRGSQRFQRQWLIASPGEADLAAISAAQAVPRIGEPVASDPNIRWLPLTAWSDIVDVGAAIDDLSAARKATIAYASIGRKTAGDAELSFGADGLYEIWLNGERVFSQQGPPRFVPDGQRIPVRLKQGENRIYLQLRPLGRGPWRFALRVLEPGAIPSPFQEILPEIAAPRVPQTAGLFSFFGCSTVTPTLDIADCARLVVVTDVVKRPQAAPVEVEVIDAGGEIVAHGAVPRGESITFQNSKWQDGPYELRLRTRDIWGRVKVAHLPWFKGDMQASIDALKKDATSAAANDPRGATLRTLAAVIDRHLQSKGVDEAQLQPALMEYEELRRGMQARPGGFRRLAYVDDIDGSVQFCRVYLPLEYTSSQRWPLVMYLHGYNPANPEYHGWWSVDQRHSVIADEHGTIYIEPHGRGNTQYQGIGERDALRCLDEAKRQFSVDEDRIYLTGESMGGHGTWRVGSRNPQLFAAIAPVFGGWDFRVVPPSGPPSGFTPATTVRDAFVHEGASSYSGLEGLLNVPVLVTHGDVDRAVNVEGSRHATRMLQRWNYDVRYHEMPGYGHEDLGERGSIVDWLLEHRRDAAPKHVRIRSTDLSGAQAHWVAVQAFEEPMRVIRVDAEVVRPGLVRIDSDNVAAMTLTLPSELRGRSETVVAIWNGKPHDLISDSNTLVLANSAIDTRELRKRPGLEGPLVDVINTPFAVVVGTTSRDPVMRQYCAEKAEAFVALWRIWQHQPLRVFKDTEISRADQEKYSLILIGGADANAVTRSLGSRLPLTVNTNSVTIGGRRIVATDAVAQMVYPNPLNNQRYVMAVAATSAAGMYFWKPALVHYSFGFALSGWDWVVQDGRVPPLGEPPRLEGTALAAGVFDARWRVHDAATIVTGERRTRWPLRHAPSPQLQPSAADLQGNVGRYELFPGGIVEVAYSAGALTIQFPGQTDTAPLIAESATAFSLPMIGEPVEFVRDSQGRATAMQLVNQGMTYSIRRLP